MPPDTLPRHLRPGSIPVIGEVRDETVILDPDALRREASRLPLLHRPTEAEVAEGHRRRR